MQRKLIQLGQKTLLVSIPTKIVEKYDLKKGTEVNIEDENDRLCIRMDGEKSTEKTIEFDLTKAENLSRRVITTAYRAGYDQIKLRFEDESVLNEIASCLSDETIGMEIISQEKNQCIVKDLSGANGEDFDIVFRRLFHLILDQAKSSSTLSESELNLRDRAVNKFANFCIRSQKKSISKNERVYYHLIKKLEAMSDLFCRLDDDERKEVEKIIPLVAELTEHIFKFDLTKLSFFLAKIKTQMNSCKKDKLLRLIQELKSMVSDIIELNYP
ncbi:MAG: AbrB/MazE/SpoVT family DNA-binding domain-containing protein [Candidatus Woesearchaeota archaeon]|nr:AbrB/MazE/SpoVT family DNA-binding domain-containing protein [Candidatus Woesearchaeota archaeon]